MSGKILLTSTAITPERAKSNMIEILPMLKTKKAVIITTAAKDKENNKWNIKSREEMLEMGLEVVDFIDLEVSRQIDLSSYSVTYVCGGNTFKLLKYVQESNFNEEVIKFLNSGGLYIGASAGAIIATPTIAIAGEVEPDENDVNLRNLNGMNLVNFEILPHYSPEQDSQLEEYKKKTKNEIRLITNDEVILVEVNKI